MHDGSAPSKVLDKVLERYAQSIYGTYDELNEAKADIENTSSTHEVGKAFVKAHKVYWLYNEEGKHINDSEVEVDDETFEPCETELQNVVDKFNAVEKRIAEAMYTKAVSGSYTEKHFFDELKFVEALYKDGKSVDIAAARAMADAGTLRPLIVDYKVEEDEVFTEQILHREFYDNKANEITYIQDEVIEQVYNDLLVEQYLLDEDVAAVRNSHARKINVLKIEKYSSFANNADALVKHLVDAIYSSVPAATDTHVRFKAADIDAYYDELFDNYATVNKGLYSEIQNNAAAKAIVTDLQKVAGDIYKEVVPEIDGVAAPQYTYYENTTYGDLIEDYVEYKEAGDDYDKLDMSLYNKFTSTGTTTEDEAIDNATIEIDQSKTITKGWFIKGSQPSLDSNGKINERLFKISVANSKLEIPTDATDTNENLIALEAADRIEKGTSGWARRENRPENEKSSFLCSINGAYFLKFEGQYSESDWWRDIVYDDGSAYYVVQVTEAAKDNKLKAKGANSYSKTREAGFLNTTIEEISQKVAETGSYGSLSKEYWLKKMNIKYHDQKVYDYFKSNYPDLFD